MMEVITQRNLISDVLKRWKHQYQFLFENSNVEEKGMLLEQLDLTKASAADVEAIIGNDSWTTFYCMECHLKKLDAVVLANDSVVLYLCFSCVEEAHKKMLQSMAKPV